MTLWETYQKLFNYLLLRRRKHVSSAIPPIPAKTSAEGSGTGAAAMVTKPSDATVAGFALGPTSSNPYCTTLATFPSVSDPRSKLTLPTPGVKAAELRPKKYPKPGVKTLMNALAV